MERPLSLEDDDYIERDLIVIFVSMASFEYQFLPEDMGRRLYDILLIVAKKMWFQNINPFSKSLYEDVYKMPIIARKVFEKVYGEYYTPSYTEESTPQPVTGFLPAGCQPQQKRFSLEVSPNKSDISSQS